MGSVLVNNILVSVPDGWDGFWVLVTGKMTTEVEEREREAGGVGVGASHGVDSC
jgi:hypothetical protein